MGSSNNAMQTDGRFAAATDRQGVRWPEVTARTIIFDWFAVPVSAAVGVVFSRWGQNNLALVLALPIVVLLWRMFVLSARRPEAPPDDRHLRNRIANWHALGIVACLFLMVFEAGVAGMAESRTANATVWATFVACTYVPFVLFSALAEWALPKSSGDPAAS